MKKNVTKKTGEIAALYGVLSNAKYTNLEDADKIRLWKIARVMKPIAIQFEDDKQSAAKDLVPYENFADDVDKAREYEESVTKADCDASKLPIGAAEYDKIVKAVNNYNKLIAEAVKEYGEKEVKIEFEPLTEDAFAKLMSGNDWSIGVASEIGDLISE